MRLIHSSPLGALDIPGVLGSVKPGEVFDIPLDSAAALLAQVDVFAPADALTGLTVDELVAVAHARRVDTEGLKKADLIKALGGAEEETGA